MGAGKEVHVATWDLRARTQTFGAPAQTEECTEEARGAPGAGLSCKLDEQAAAAPRPARPTWPEAGGSVGLPMEQVEPHPRGQEPRPGQVREPAGGAPLWTFLMKAASLMT